jgi:hypothetical protein
MHGRIALRSFALCLTLALPVAAAWPAARCPGVRTAAVAGTARLSSSRSFQDW